MRLHLSAGLAQCQADSMLSTVTFTMPPMISAPGRSAGRLSGCHRPRLRHASGCQGFPCAGCPGRACDGPGHRPRPPRADSYPCFGFWPCSWCGRAGGSLCYSLTDCFGDGCMNAWKRTNIIQFGYFLQCRQQVRGGGD